jgi:hypothetical protein
MNGLGGFWRFGGLDKISTGCASAPAKAGSVQVRGVRCCGERKNGLGQEWFCSATSFSARSKGDADPYRMKNKKGANKKVKGVEKDRLLYSFLSTPCL